MAASVATDELHTYAEVTPVQAACYNRLKWLELRLGRLPQILAWHEVDSVVRSVLAEKGYSRERLSHGEIEFDAVLGMLLLKTDIWELKRLSSIPDVLDRLGLHCSAAALHFALGHEGDLPKELVGDRTGDALQAFFQRWRNQPAAADLPAAPLLYDTRVVALQSNVLGCHIAAESENATPCVELAEWVLAGLESLLSTCMLEDVVAREPIVTVKLRKSDFVHGPFAFDLQDRDGRPHVDVRCARIHAEGISHGEQERLKEKMLELLAHLLARAFMPRSPQEFIGKLFRDELALERSLNFTTSFVTLANVLGSAPKTTMSAWAEPGAHDYPLRRSEEWDAAERRAKRKSHAASETPKPTFGRGVPPAELRDRARTKHTEIEMVSPIREALWKQAGWSGTAFLRSPDDSAPPAIAPIFRDAQAAKKIFAQWRKELGRFDEEERLRVTIIRGIRRKEPHAYRVVVGANPRSAVSRAGAKYVVMMSRVNTMMPSSGENLEGFLKSYEKHGVYALVYAVHSGDPKDAVPVWDNHIVKREIHVRDAWQIGKHDVDSVGIREDDDPIIPAGQEDPPVAGLLQARRQPRA